MDKSRLEVIPYLSFSGDCEQALEVYIRAFGGEVIYISRWSEEHCESPEQAGKVMHAEFRIGCTRMSGGDSFEKKGPNTNIKLMVHMGSTEEAENAISVLLEGGGVGADAVAAAGNSGSLQELYGPTPLQAAAEAGAEALRGGPLTAFEKLCDDAVGEYLAGAQFVPFGEAPLLGYLAARETEYTNIRILLMGRGAGLPAEVIRSRLRNGYV